MNRKRLTDQLIRHEGTRAKPYQDSVGKWTIGVGRNLDDVGLSEGEIQILLDHDIDQVVEELNQTFPEIMDSISAPRQEVLINMCFNLGLTRLLRFKKMWAALQEGDYMEAAEQMKDSKWYTQVKSRGVELCDIMKKGVY